MFIHNRKDLLIGPSGLGENHVIINRVSDQSAPARWSVMIPTYNCALYLRETLKSVLSQDPGPANMQIEVVDDCSTNDDPEAVVREVGSGRVGFYRQPKNVGHTRNFDTCLQRSRGHLVHLLHGDDYVRPGFYTKLGSAFTADHSIGAAFCRTIFTDQNGHWISFSDLEKQEPGILENFAERLALQQRIQTPSMVVRRSVYEHLGGFDARLSWTEDWEMWLRIAASYPIWYEPEPLAVYRLHKNSSTSNKILTGENVQDLRRCISINCARFPEPIAHRVRSAALETYAHYALGTMRQLLSEGRKQAAYIQFREALRCHAGLGVIVKAARSLVAHTLRRSPNKPLPT